MYVHVDPSSNSSQRSRPDLQCVRSESVRHSPYSFTQALSTSSGDEQTFLEKSHFDPSVNSLQSSETVMHLAGTGSVRHSPLSFSQALFISSGSGGDLQTEAAQSHSDPSFKFLQTMKAGMQ